ncbi:leucine-rich repeat-containing protein 63 [Erinaceus europaeus]|uniref:Leucine-rich repeat-containing protein 63 n=1 Tax=Erinaceus europaeus TaxID=9365 RepID=A0A1S2ZLP0_ERIEU|nr:leucine-rich repeat-containing protein 63 [Erinaceus europaeus]
MKNYPQLLRRPLPPKLPKLPLYKKGKTDKTMPSQVGFIQDEITSIIQRDVVNFPDVSRTQSPPAPVTIHTVFIDDQVQERVATITTSPKLSRAKIFVQVSKTITGSVFFPTSHPASSRIFKRKKRRRESSRKSKEESGQLKYIYLGSNIKELQITDFNKPLNVHSSVPYRHKDYLLLSKYSDHALKKKQMNFSAPETTSRLGTTPIKQERRWLKQLHQTTVSLSVTDFPGPISLPKPQLPRKPARQTEIEAENVANILKPKKSVHSEAPIKIKLDPETPSVHGEGLTTIAATCYETIVSMTNLAIKTCQIYGRNALNLKGFFITYCPDLTALAFQLVYLNLSFNHLSLFPTEVYCLKNLQVLILRNNPIKEIPSEIQQLKFLRIFNMAFNYITMIPPGFFSLSHLEKVDLSYNDIPLVPNEIHKLRSLEKLNLNGNELTSFPPALLKLNLKTILFDNNFTHPNFWKENSLNNPQRLIHLASLSFLKSNQYMQYSVIPEEIQMLLKSTSRCDCCHGPRFGEGFRIIRGYNIFGVTNLPILFNVCSSSCYRAVKEGNCLLDNTSITRINSIF